jgi:hypothetical protein
MSVEAMFGVVGGLLFVGIIIYFIYELLNTAGR